VRFLCLIPLYRQYEPPMAELKRHDRLGLATFLRQLPTTNFGRFCIFVFFVIFGTTIMGPYIGVYLLKSLGMGYIGFTSVTMTFLVMSFVAMGYWGKIADRHGNYRILVATAIGIPFIALGCVFFKSLPLLIGLQVFSGFVWAGFNLASTNFIFDAIRREHTPQAWAYYNTMLNVAAFLGTLCGGWIIHLVENYDIPIFSPGNFEILFIASFIMRGLPVVIFAKRFKEVRAIDSPKPSLRHLYLYRPVGDILNAFSGATGIVVRKRRRDKDCEE
jgi:MFS family permease